MNIDAWKYIPKPLKDVGGAWNNYKTFLQNQIDYFINRIFSIRWLFWPERGEYTNEMGTLVGAYFSESDSSRDAVQKYAFAGKTHKWLPVFSEVYVPLIVGITGVTPVIYKGTIVYRYFVIDGSLIDSPALIDNASFSIVQPQKGAIYIDLQTIPSIDQLEKIVSQIKDLVPIYFLVYIGYGTVFDSAAFTLDSSLIDGIDLIDIDTPPASDFTVLTVL